MRVGLSGGTEGSDLEEELGEDVVSLSFLSLSLSIYIYIYLDMYTYICVSIVVNLSPYS